MRRVYRDRFTLISVHSPTEQPLESLQKRIAKSHDVPEKWTNFLAQATKIMARTSMMTSTIRTERARGIYAG